MTGHEARPENERCLITGGAGFLGINLARFLLAEGYSVTSLDIAPLDCPDLAGRVRTVQGDIRDPDSVRQALEGAAVVVHAAAALPLYPVDVIRSTDVDGLRNLLEICQESRVRRVVCISSTAVYGIPDHHPPLEDDRHQG